MADETKHITIREDQFPKGKINLAQLRDEMAAALGVEPAALGLSMAEAHREERYAPEVVREGGVEKVVNRPFLYEQPRHMTVHLPPGVEYRDLAEVLAKHAPELDDHEWAEQHGDPANRPSITQILARLSALEGKA